jgi:hypothetical protein
MYFCNETTLPISRAGTAVADGSIDICIMTVAIYIIHLLNRQSNLKCIWRSQWLPNFTYFRLILVTNVHDAATIIFVQFVRHTSVDGFWLIKSTPS